MKKNVRKNTVLSFISKRFLLLVYARVKDRSEFSVTFLSKKSFYKSLSTFRFIIREIYQVDDECNFMILNALK